MINEDFIRGLKQTNVSVDAEKTKERTTSAWRSATREVQKAILELAGVSRTTIHRAYKVGTISAKLTLSMAQVLNRDPFYFTGETDEPGVCEDELLKQFLLNHGYDKVPKSARPKGTKAGKPAGRRSKAASRPRKSAAAQAGGGAGDAGQKTVPDEPAKHQGASAPAAASGARTSPEAPVDDGAVTLAGALTEEEMVLLLKSVLLRAKAGGKYAELAEKLKLLLITY